MTLWTMRAAWLLAGAAAPWASWNGASDPVRTVASAWGWIAWSVVMLAAAVTLPVSLTVIRLGAPVAVLLSVGAWPAGVGDDVARATVGTAVVIVAGLLGASAPVAAAMVGGGAYGNEVRLPLRTPVPHLAPAAVSWSACVAGCVGGSLLVAVGASVVGITGCVLGAALCAVVPRRLHGLSRRWLVRVPAGLVVHDHLVLAETLMIRRHDLSSVTVATVAGPEADLTGGVVGRRLVVAVARPATATLTPVATRIVGAGPALHVSSFAVAPLRPAEAEGLFGGSARRARS